jgi:TP901 family phage tail tape measure protein
MAVELATAYVALVPSAAGITAKLQEELGGPLESVASEAGESTSSSFGASFTDALPGIATAAAAVFAAAFGAAIALADLGGKFDDSFDSLRVKTGKTDGALGGLEDSFRNVVKNVPTDFDSASSAIGTLNQKLGLTGRPLEDLSTQVINLSRITGTDLSANLDASANLFNNWGIDAAKQGPKLDELFRISQQTGISVSDLASTMADSGSQFRAAGLSFEDSGALLGLLSKNGLDASSVVPALSKAMATAAKDGKPVAEVFQSTLDAIKNAPDEMAGAQAAIEIFGARAGPNLAQLIREGKLGYEDLAKTITSGDSINAAAQDTDDWHEKLQVLINKGLLKLEPIATKVFDAITKAITWASPYLEKFGDWLGKNLPKLAAAAQKFFEEKLLPAFRAIADWVQEHWPQIQKIIVDVMTAVGDIISNVSDLIATIWRNYGDKIKAVVETVWGFVGGTISAVMEQIRGIIDIVMGIIHGDWSRVWNGIKELFGGIWDEMKAKVEFVIGIIQTILETAWRAIAGVAETAWNALKALADTIWDAIKTAITAPIDAAKAVIDAVWTALSAAADAAWGAIKTAADKAWDAIKTAVTAPIDAAKTAIDAIWTTLSNAASTAWGALKTAADTAWSLIKSAVTAPIDAAKALLDTVWSTIKSAASTAWDGLKTAASTAWEAIKDAVMWPITLLTGALSLAWDDIKTAATAVWDGIKAAADTAWGLIKTAVTAPIDAAKTLISGTWDAIVETITGLPGRIASAASGMWDGIKTAFKTSVNTIIGWWNGIQFKMPTISIPEIHIPGIGSIGGGSFGGWTFGTPDIPYLAAGAAVTSPTVAMLGEYPGAGSNPEIVSPRSIMAETFADVLRDWSPSSGMPTSMRLVLEDGRELRGYVEEVADVRVGANNADLGRVLAMGVRR